MSVTERTRPTTEPFRHARMLIAGAWSGSASDDTPDIENPAKWQKIRDVPRGGAADADRAVLAASQAFASWTKVTPRDRGRVLLRIAEALEARSAEQAPAIALETGNPEEGLTAVIYVSRGKAALGIVFDTHAKLDPGVTVVGTLATDTHPPIVYTIAAVACSTSPATPRELTFLQSGSARTMVAAHGYTVLSRP